MAKLPEGAYELLERLDEQPPLVSAQDLKDSESSRFVTGCPPVGPRRAHSIHTKKEGARLHGCQDVSY